MRAGKVDIVAAILQFSSKPAGSSTKELQRMTNLGAKQLDVYLKMVEKKHLITISASGNVKGLTSIKITERGNKFLDMYEAVKMKYLTASPST
jgi:predicted transcriptional regulator